MLFAKNFGWFSTLFSREPISISLVGSCFTKEKDESRSEDTLVLLVKLVKSTVMNFETVENVETAAIGAGQNKSLMKKCSKVDPKMR